MPTITQRVAAFTANLQHAAIPDEVLEKTKVSLLHNLAVGLAGAPMAQSSLRYAREFGDSGTAAQARLLLSGEKTTPRTAAFVNAALMHARAQDDVYFPGLTHVGAIVTPAVLAVAEQLGRSGQDTLTALVAGYEATGCLSQGFAQLSTARGFRASGIYGVLGAAAAVARLLRLDSEATANALGIAASMSSGTNQAWISGSQEWQFHTGMASSNGILAAQLAAADGTGAPDAMEGRAGFYQAFVGQTENMNSVGIDLGTRWHSLSVTYKPLPVCAILQGPVLTAIEFAHTHNLSADQISAVRLLLPPAEALYPGTDATGPFHGTGATLMSAQFCLSVALTQRQIKGVDLLRLNDQSLSMLMQRTQVIADPHLTSRSFVLELELTEGRTLHKTHRAVDEPFNWNRNEVLDNIVAMADELPVSFGQMQHIATLALSLEMYNATELMDACVIVR